MRRLATVLLVSFAGTAASADAQERRTVRDPAGATAWTAELRTADARGQTCVVLRRGRTGKGRFCSRLSSRTVFQYTTRRETGGDDPRRWRTIIVVALAPDVERATLRTTDGMATYRRGRGPRVLLAVLAGDVEQGLLRATVRSGSRTRTATAGTVPRVTVPDPRGDDPWRLARDAGGTRACVRWERVRRFTTPARTVRARGPERCAPRGGAAPVPLAFAETVDERLVITGVAADGVRSVVLRGQAGSTRVARDPDTGAFLAVLAGDVDPASLRVVARLLDGRQVIRPLERADAR
jgi:hypothetical protein